MSTRGMPLIEDRRDIWRQAGRLKEHWYVACTAAELRRRKIVAANVLGLGVAIFRDGAGSVAAILDQCLHRGTALSAGRLADGCVTCPYHGWRYDARGRVVHIPTEDGAHPPAKPHAKSQRTFPCREAYGLIWIYPGDCDPDARPIFEMPFWRAPGWVNYYMSSRFDGDVSALAQNFMDVPHTVHVHNKIFRSSPERLIRSTVAFTPHSVEVDYHEPDDAIGLMPWLVNPEHHPLEHTDKFFTPNVTRCDYHWGDRSGFVITSQITPESSRGCRVHTLISYRFPVPRAVLRAIRPLIHVYTRIVLQQDIRIMRTNQRGRDNAPDASPNHVKADLVHIGIDRLIDATRRGEPLPPRLIASRPMEFNL